MEPRVEKFEQTLRIALDDQEVARRADRMAHVVKEIGGKESEATAVSKRFKGEIARLEAERDLLASEVRDRATYGEVECRRVYDYREGVVTITREDTGEILDTRALTERERQLSLVRDDPKEEAPGDDGKADEGQG